MDNGWVQRRTAACRERIEFELDSIGVEQVDDVRDLCSVPVEYTQNGWPIRSEPGDSPRREHGHLWESFHHTIHSSANTAELSVYNTAHYAHKLHWTLNRPFFTHLRDLARWSAESVKQRLYDALTGGR